MKLFKQLTQLERKDNKFTPRPMSDKILGLHLGVFCNDLEAEL